MILFAVAAAAAVALFVLSRTVGLPRRLIVVLAVGTGLYVFAGIWLMYEWIHGDYQRSVWIIRQAAPCTSMGGGPYQLWTAAGAAFSGLVALMVAAAVGLDRRSVRDGVVLAGVLSGATALAMFPNPALFARLLGCV